MAVFGHARHKPEEIERALAGVKYRAQKPPMLVCAALERAYVNVMHALPSARAHHKLVLGVKFAKARIVNIKRQKTREKKVKYA